MKTDPTAQKMRDFLYSLPYAEEYDNLDVEEAIYWFATNFHGGQRSNLYSAICASEYKPGPFTNGPCDDMLYDELVAQFTTP